MNKTELAKRFCVTRQTITNWEKNKPELIRLIKLGLNSDDQYREYLDLFPKQGCVYLLHEFYIDFYFKFLNYFRQNITNPRSAIAYNEKDIFSTTIIYMLENDKKQLFPPAQGIDDKDISKFASDEFKKPLFVYDKNLSEYILRNLLDDFETLLKDIILHDSKGEDFYSALYIAITYLIYKLEPDLSLNNKAKKCHIILSEIFEIDYVTQTIDNAEETYAKYLEFRLDYTQKHIQVIKTELDKYNNNDFYVPAFIKKIKPNI